MPRLFQFKRGTAAVKPTLNDGEPYLERDTATLVVNNQGTEIRLAKSTEIDAVNSSISTLSGNVASLNSEIDTKLTTPTGTTGQLLGFTANNVVGAIDSPFEHPAMYNTAYSTTIATSGWTNVSGRYRYTVNVSGMTADQHPLVFPVWSSNKTNEETAWNSIEPTCESFAGGVYFYAPAAISTAVSVVIVFAATGYQAVALNNSIGGATTRTEGLFYPASE